MHTIVNTIQEIKGTKTEVLMLFGTGRLTNDPPELRETGTGKKVLSSQKGHRFAIAFYNGQNKDASFYGIEAWEKTAELMKNLTFKGQEVEVGARIKTEHFEVQGEKRTAETLVIEKFNVKGYKEGSKPTTSSTSTTNSSAPSEAKELVGAGHSGPIEVSDDDLPF